MNRHLIRIGYFLFLGLLSPIARAQVPFEGEIQFQVKTESADLGSQGGTLTFFTHSGNLLVIADVPDIPGLQTKMLFSNTDSAVFVIMDSSKSVIRLDLSAGKKKPVTGNVPDEYKDAYQDAAKDTGENPDSLKIEFADMKETRNIAGFDCRKNKVTGDENLTESWVWMTKAIFIAFPMMNNKPGMLGKFFTREGFPLRIENTSSQDGVIQKLTAEAIQVNRHPVDPARFKIPQGYKVQDLMNFFKE